LFSIGTQILEKNKFSKAAEESEMLENSIIYSGVEAEEVVLSVYSGEADPPFRTKLNLEFIFS